MEEAVLDAPPAPRAALRRRRTADPQQLVVDTIARHADSVLRIARRYSSCQADAEDAYQRALEIFVRQAHRLDPATVDGWLRTVAKHEALAVRAQRKRYVGVADDDTFDALADARHLPSVEERTERFDELTRTAEALQRLKPQEQTALLLRAQGLTYHEIAARQQWTYTKVNRCVTEGRRALLERIEGLRSGAECERWAPILSAMADGEASAEQLVDVRPHLRNCTACRAVLSGMERAGAPVAALLPVGLVAGETVPSGGGLLGRFGELMVGLQERFVGAHQAMEAMSAGKVAAVAASAAAVAGGGVAVERSVAERPPVSAPAAAEAAVTTTAAPAAPVPEATAPATTPAATTVATEPKEQQPPAQEEFAREEEFGGGGSGGGEFATTEEPPAAEQAAATAPEPTPAPAPTPSFEQEAQAAGGGGGEFGAPEFGG